MGSHGLQLGPLPKRTGLGLQLGAKSLLRNMIRHTDTHNRLLEEAEMWQLHKRMKDGSSSPEDIDRRGGKGSGGLKEPKIENSFLYDDRRAVDSPTQSRYGQKRRAHMDEEGLGCILMKRGGELSGDQRGQSSSTYWQRQLFKAEENDSDRWGHGGFKELYPQDFASDRSEDEGKKEEAKKVKKAKKVKQKKDKESGKKKKSKHKHNEKTKHKNKKKKKLDESYGTGDGRDVSKKKVKKRKISESLSGRYGDEANRRKQKREDNDIKPSSKKKRKWERERNLLQNSSESKF